MITTEQTAEIRRLFYAEHWAVGTIAAQLGLHPDTVRAAVAIDRFNRSRAPRPRLTDPYETFIRETLQLYPRLRATRIAAMIRARGYAGSVVQVRRLVARLRPAYHEAFVQRRTFPGEEAQVDWAHFGEVRVGRARRKLSCFVMTLSYSRALALEFFFDQSLENFLTGHGCAFAFFQGVVRTLLYDNLRSAVLQRHGTAVQLHPRLLELCAHYHCAARPFTTLEDFNRQARAWRDDVAHRRPWPADPGRTVQEAFAEEQTRLLPLPLHPFDTDRVVPVHTGKTIYVRFDLNDYSIPPECVGRQLTLVASNTQVRLLEAGRLVACHRRSFDRRQLVLDPAHQQALLEQKRQALGATPSGRLLAAAPEIEALLAAAVERGEPASTATTQLLKLLDDYGASELRAAVREALQRQTPRPSSIAFILAQRHRLKQRRALIPVDLKRRPDLEHLHVQPHAPETYDELADHDPDD